MKFCAYGKDGGDESTVWGFWLVEFKSLFSIAVLRFEPGSRDAYHSHAFDCISWVLGPGKLIEYHLDGAIEEHAPSLRPVFTYKRTFHKVVSVGRTYVLTFRGPWVKTWREYLPNNHSYITLASGRRVAANDHARRAA